SCAAPQAAPRRGKRRGYDGAGGGPRGGTGGGLRGVGGGPRGRAPAKTPTLRAYASPAARPGRGERAPQAQPVPATAEPGTARAESGSARAQPEPAPGARQGTPGIGPVRTRHAREDVVLVTRENRRDQGACLGCRGRCGQDQAFS